MLLARWLLTAPKLLLLDEPTRGIDVGAKAEIQRLVAALADDGLSVLFISAELDEVLRLSHRIVVMRELHKVAELDNRGTTVERPDADHRRGRRDRGCCGGGAMKAIVSHRLFWPVVILVALLVATRLKSPIFFDINIRQGNVYGPLITILRRVAPTLLVAMGMTLVISTRGIDLSVGAVAAIAGAAAATFIDSAAHPNAVVDRARRRRDRAVPGRPRRSLERLPRDRGRNPADHRHPRVDDRRDVGSPS